MKMRQQRRTDGPILQMKWEEMKTPIRLAVAVAVCVSIIWTAARADATTVWPAYEHDRSHSGRSQYNTSGNNGAIKWELPTGVTR
jgi:hypothetical protein